MTRSRSATCASSNTKYAVAARAPFHYQILTRVRTKSARARACRVTSRSGDGNPNQDALRSFRRSRRNAGCARQSARVFASRHFSCGSARPLTTSNVPARDTGGVGVSGGPHRGPTWRRRPRGDGGSRGLRARTHGKARLLRRRVPRAALTLHFYGCARSPRACSCSPRA